MEVIIYEGEKGPIVIVKGSVNDEPTKVARAYKDTLIELAKEDKE